MWPKVLEDKKLQHRLDRVKQTILERLDSNTMAFDRVWSNRDDLLKCLNAQQQRAQLWVWIVSVEHELGIVDHPKTLLQSFRRTGKEPPAVLTKYGEVMTERLTKRIEEEKARVRKHLGKQHKQQRLL